METVKIKIGKYKYKEHSKYKNELMDLFKKEPSFKNDLYKVDFNNSTDFKRPWVKMIKESFGNSFKSWLKEMKFGKLHIKNLWFQQYNKDNKHDWHIHGCSFSGVYYVNYNNKCIGTELIDPYSNKIIKPKVSEGDVIIFPAFVIHRAPVEKTNNLKTIISFNFDCEL
tara:strand:+ start:1465 stop:1968 length:504 start_codon:yes stop_codon:yes gene_type:complete